MNPFAANTNSIQGSIAPLVTPFQADGALDVEAVAALVDWQLSHGTHAISVGGSTGEPTSQTVVERVAVMRAASKAIDGRVPFLPGTGSRDYVRDARANGRGRAPRRRGRPHRDAVLQQGTARRLVQLVFADRRTSSRTCRSSSTTSRFGRLWRSPRRP